MNDAAMRGAGIAYRARTLQRVAQIAEAVERLAADGADAAARDTIRQIAHQLSGSGTVYGLPDLSRFAALLEADTAEPDGSNVQRWRELVAEMKAALERGADTDTPPSSPIGPEPATARILSVEDDPEYASYLSALLQSAGYDVRVCPRPDALDEQLASYRPDLLLMDVVLPGTTGYELGRQVRLRPAYATLPILFLTTQQQLEARLAGIAAGGDDYLVKTDRPALLLATIAARIERARVLRQLVDRDGLTQLFTHTAFTDRVEAIAAERRREPGRGAALAMLDVDHFKAVNDRHGHAAGDAVLRALAAFLAHGVRAADVVGRYGGEEFGIVFRGTTADAAAGVLTTLGAEFARLAHGSDARGGPFYVTFSAGVAGWRGGLTAREWIEKADAALYQAKAAGRNRVCVSQEE